jgi:predicted DNA-binding transcriptional regulator YafY
VGPDFTAWVATYVRERVWSSDREKTWDENGDLLRRSFGASSEDELISWILSFGANGRLLEPEKLVEKVVKNLGRMTGRYRRAGEL